MTSSGGGTVKVDGQTVATTSTAAPAGGGTAGAVDLSNVVSTPASSSIADVGTTTSQTNPNATNTQNQNQNQTQTPAPTTTPSSPINFNPTSVQQNANPTTAF